MFSLNFEKCPVCKAKLKLTPWQRIKSFRPRPCPQCGMMLVRHWWAVILALAGMEMGIAIGDIFDVDKHEYIRHMVLSGHKNIVLTAMYLWGLVGMVMLCAGLFYVNRYRVAKSGKTDNIEQ